MGFNPLHERGIPLERQLRNWSELNVAPFDTRNVDPYTRCRVIFMNGIEVEAIINSHQFNRHTAGYRDQAEPGDGSQNRTAAAEGGQLADPGRRKHHRQHDRL